MKYFYILILLLASTIGFSQTVNIHGIVLDSLTREPLIGVTIKAKATIGGQSQADGHFKLALPEGHYILQISYTGYIQKQIPIQIQKQELSELIILLQRQSKALNQITISGSRFEKRIAEEVVSIEVIKLNYILNTANNQVDDALQRVPGVDVIENQVNIRGGAGWSYGAGSRVLVLVDDMPMLTSDAQDAKWDFLPLENCEQIEVLKGASSSLYGSSALNGVVNFRTGFAKSKPITKAMIYNGMYGNPPEKNWKWWGKQQPNFNGGYLMHAQKIKQWDLVLGTAWFSEDSYLQGDLNRRGRTNMNLRHQFKKVEGLIAGVNTNIQLNKSQTFFFWEPSDTGRLKPYGGLADSTTTINKNQGLRFNIDPYITYQTATGSKHTLRTRFFRSRNRIPEKKQSSIADSYYGEYQFQKKFEASNKWYSDFNIIGGLVNNYSHIIGELYGNHTTNNTAGYIQFEKKFIKKLWTSLGMRYEINAVDTYRVERKPVFRAGLNYELAQATFVRWSWGQGYRYPSIAERFVSTSFGASRVFPNTSLQSETGWSSELGIKQGFKLGSWSGLVDVAAFWTEYKNMMEFNFGIHDVPKDSAITLANINNYLGFKSINVGTARITGLDISIAAQGKISKAESRVILGYTYMNPIQVNPDSIIMANISGTTNTLKYRYNHSFKLDWENSYQGAILGLSCFYNSFMKNIDEVFQNSKPKQNFYGLLFEAGSHIPSSVDTFRKQYNKGTLLFDARLQVKLSSQIKIGFVVKNVLNQIYAERPAILGPLRNFTIQLFAEL
ncbi:MAG: TonB-dependent receptor [Chitinophagaceae bacterium]